MNTFKVTLEFTGPQLLDFLNSVPLGTTVDVKLAAPSGVSVPVLAPELAPKRKPRQVRALRGSKVNRTVLEALANGPQTTKQLKDALEAADLAPGSLSTGLAALQKSGQVAARGGGIYALDEMAATQ